MRPTRSAGLVLLVGCVLSGGCVAAAGAAAGAGAATYVQNQKKESVAKVDPATAADWTRSAFEQLGITVTKTEEEKDGAEREIHGKNGSTEVSVHLDGQADGTTKVQVTAKINPVNYDGDYAQKVLDTILKQGG